MEMHALNNQSFSRIIVIILILAKCFWGHFNHLHPWVCISISIGHLLIVVNSYLILMPLAVIFGIRIGKKEENIVIDPIKYRLCRLC